MTRRLLPVLVLSFFATAAWAQNGKPAPPADAEAPRQTQARAESESGSKLPPISLRAGMGFTADPTTFLMTFEVPFGLTEHWSVGPLVQIGVSDDETLVSPTVNVAYTFDISSKNRHLRKLKPYAQAGLGFTYLKDDTIVFGDDDDFGFLINMGAGADYWLTEEFGVGTSMHFNVLPEDALGENFYFSWQVLTARFRF